MILRSPPTTTTWIIRFLTWFVFFSVLNPLSLQPLPVHAAPKIIDYQNNLPRKFSKRRRKSTDYIIIHSTESGLVSGLRSLARGGYTNYLVARNGTVYRILHKDYRANHAGRSMWNRRENISDYSIGIELVGYHNNAFTQEQYESLKWLIEVFQKQYKIPDREVLEHYRVAYGKPNRYVKKAHRGRKKDPGVFNFSRSRAGLTSKDKRNSVLYDPDVQAGRLIADPDIDVARLKETDGKKYAESVAALSENVITARNSAWRIAREEYNSPLTVYRFPNGTVMRGDEIKDWEKIPKGTRLYLNRQGDDSVQAVAAHVPIIKTGFTAFDIAGPSYKRSDTYYIFPKGTIKHGQQIRRWSRIPSGTRVLVKYNKPVPLDKTNRNTARKPETVFLVPKSQVLAAAQVPDVSRLKSGTLMFVKK
ncbi:MAG: peptidoglycan recognition family protein [Candidatus Latescibacteria bacterium]|jgi:hypothetical protein|nr:peptidoglycan recognition family protein [Candidatus Latescibacterota bacterium]MDP7235852.1 peptidoglycan recognition family protein [Candidatus Latescibacterota bacterium]